MLSVVVTLAIIGLFTRASRDLCANEVYAEVLSPDKTHRAVVFQRDCGATTGFSTHISVLGLGEELANESGNVFIADGQPAKEAAEFRWLTNNELRIRRILDGSEYKAEQIAGPLNKISVSYGTGSE